MVIDIDKLVGERLDADADFQSRVANLSDDERTTETEKRRKEILADELEKRDTIAADQRRRAEKAEKDAEDLKKDPRLAPKDGTATEEKQPSYEEIVALQGAKVHPEFVKTVQNAAKILGKTITEALKDPIVIAQIEHDNEVRTSANVVDIGKPRAGAGGDSDKEVLDATRGVNGQREIPAAGSEKAEQLYRARRKNQFQNQSRR